MSDRAVKPGKKQKENTMIFHFTEGEYRAPRCFIIRLDEEADVCVGTNEPGHDYDDDNDLGDL